MIESLSLCVKMVLKLNIFGALFSLYQGSKMTFGKFQLVNRSIIKHGFHRECDPSDLVDIIHKQYIHYPVCQVFLPMLMKHKPI